MGQILKLTSPIPASVNHYLGTRAIIKNGRPFAMVYETKEAKDYKTKFKNYILEQVKKQEWDLPVIKTQHFYCDCVFYFDRIDKDCNNYFKLLLDAITESEVIWADDNVVCERVNRIYYDSKNPRIEITIYPVDYIGIFDNFDKRNEFENKCKTCSRYFKNCSLLKKAIEGRIQEEIQDGSCMKYKVKK
jgi:Holliday junction resolvase RusA-like endonuclease